MAFGKKQLAIILGVLFLLLIVIFYSGSLLPVKTPSTSRLTNPSLTPAKDKSEEVHSPDGTMRLIMQTKPQEEGKVTYSFVLSGVSGENQKVLYTKTVEGNESMTIPLNTFSPDNKYVFLRINKDGFFDILVFKVSGDAFSNQDPYLSVQELLVKRKVDYVLVDVTGWDAETLLHVVTASENGKKGPGFWFDVASYSFLQLVR